MHANEEEKRVLGNVHATEDIQELQQKYSADGPIGRLRPEQVEQFHIITDEMVDILESKNPEVKLDPTVDNSIRFALEALFEARTSRDVSTNEFISGLVRNKQLNQALMHLQPVLSMALRPDFPDGRAIYDRLVGDVNQLRASIQQSILAQMPVRTVPKRPKAEEQDDDDDSRPTDDDDDDSQDDRGGSDRDATERAGEEAVAEGANPSGTSGDDETKEGASWLGRLLKRRGKKAEDSASDQDNPSKTSLHSDKSGDLSGKDD